MDSARQNEITAGADYLPVLEQRTWLEAFWHDHQGKITRTVAIIVVLGAWETVVRSGAVDPLFLSSPSLVAVRLVEMFSTGEIWPHILVSMQEAALGFGLAIVTGIPLGIAMGRMPLLRYTLEPFIMAKYSSPTVAFLPLLIIWLGIGLWSKVALIFLGAVFVLIINTEAGVSNVDRRLIETARSFTASERQILTKIVLPATIPFVIAAMRLAIGRVLIMVVVAELYASTAGLGHLVFQAGAMYDTTLVFVGVIILALTGIVLSEFLRIVERRVAPWLQAREG